MNRKNKAAELQRTLARYRGCRFTVGGSGGASGTVSRHERNGDEFFVGGFHGEGEPELLVRALNLVLELLYDR